MLIATIKNGYCGPSSTGLRHASARATLPELQTAQCARSPLDSTAARHVQLGGTSSGVRMRILHFSQSLLGGPATYFEEIALSQIEAFGKQNVLFVVPETGRHLIPSIPDECLLCFPFTKRNPYSLARLALFLERVVGNFGPDLRSEERRV